MTAKAIRFPSPRGRFVQGDCFEPNTTDMQGNALVVKTGPNAGQPRKEWYIAVAFSKTDPATLPYLMQIANFAASVWPRWFPNGVTNQPPLFGCINPNFSMKIMDGDGIDTLGKPNRDKAGFAGHWVVKYSSGLQAPGVWQEPNMAPMDQILDPKMVPRGYYAHVSALFDTNENDTKPGIYINLEKVMMSSNQAGAEIIQSGPTAAEAFNPSAMTYGRVPTTAALPPPAAGGLVPVAGAPYTIEALRASSWSDDQIVAAGHATRPAPLPATPPPPTAAPTHSAPPPPTNPPPPQYAGYMQPAAAPVRTMLAAAQGSTYEALIANGWTDAMLVQQGLMAP